MLQRLEYCVIAESLRDRHRHHGALREGVCSRLLPFVGGHLRATIRHISVYSEERGDSHYRNPAGERTPISMRRPTWCSDPRACLPPGRKQIAGTRTASGRPDDLARLWRVGPSFSLNNGCHARCPRLSGCHAKVPR